LMQQPSAKTTLGWFFAFGSRLAPHHTHASHFLN
jgi:hypothetical protein